MKKILSVKRNRVYIILIGIAILLLSYYCVYLNNQTKMDTIKEDMNGLNEKLAELEQFNSKKQFYLDETDRMNGEIETIISQFPSDVQPEDLIMYIKEAEDDYDVSINNATFSDVMSIDELEDIISAEETQENKNIEEIQDTEETQDLNGNQETEESQGQEITESATESSVGTNPIGYKILLDITTKTSYEGFKDLIKHITKGGYKLHITNLRTNYDETGDLSSDVTVEVYYIKNTGVEYEGTSIPQNPVGKDNIFNTQK
ncbi:hypothetical protein [Anaerosporobacter faecicola]|uniref:hypothetical protein n=1 Tax=Anaerosporobacter faecicola TaxID=2718714 RepID=UPI00143A8ABE|nr:hypothetical protein [Anaerosporobacter faecicola]